MLLKIIIGYFLSIIGSSYLYLYYSYKGYSVQCIHVNVWTDAMLADEVTHFVFVLFRNCIGQRFAMQEMKVTVAHVVNR